MFVTRIARFYYWLYYRCYRYSRKGGDSAFTVHWAIAAIQSLLLLATNLLALLLLLLVISPSTARVVFSAPPWVIGSAFGSLVFLHLLLLGYKGRYKKILKQFSKETDNQQRRGDRLFGWYLVCSVFSFLGIGIVAGVRAGF